MVNQFADLLGYYVEPVMLYEASIASSSISVAYTIYCIDIQVITFYR